MTNSNHRRDPERGSVAIWAITTAMTMVLLVGLAVDLSGRVLAKQRAQTIAAEAARAGGQQIQAGTAIRGQGVVVDPGPALSSPPELPSPPVATGDPHAWSVTKASRLHPNTRGSPGMAQH